MIHDAIQTGAPGPTRTLRRGAAVLLIGAGALWSPAQAQGNPDLSDVMDTLTAQVHLTDAQKPKVEALLTAFATGWNDTVTAYENADDNKAEIDGLKAVQKTYQDGMQEVLSAEQMTAYNAYVDTVLHQVFNEVAELKLRDLQSQLQLTEEQITQLTPIMGTALVDVVRLLWKDAGERMGVRRKLQLANDVKKIQSTAKSGYSTILSPEQMSEWDAIKKAAKDQKKG